MQNIIEEIKAQNNFKTDFMSGEWSVTAQHERVYTLRTFDGTVVARYYPARDTRWLVEGTQLIARALAEQFLAT